MVFRVLMFSLRNVSLRRYLLLLWSTQTLLNDQDAAPAMHCVYMLPCARALVEMQLACVQKWAFTQDVASLAHFGMDFGLRCPRSMRTAGY